MIFARQSTAIIVTVGPVLDASGVAVTDGVVGDFKISKNGGAPAALNGSATLTHRNTGHYSLSLTATDVNTVGTVEVVIDDTTNACPIKEITVVEPATYDVLFADAAPGPASPTNITAGTITTATNVTTVNGLAANVITAASMNADASAEIADAVWDEDATGHQTQGTFGQAIGDPAADTNTIFKAVVTDATGATVGVDVVAIKAETVEILADTAEIGAAGAGLTAINLPDQTMNITGNLSGSVGSVTGLTAATVHADLDDIQARLPAALTAGGKIKASMDEILAVAQSATDLKDFADDGYDPTTNKVQGVVLVDTVTAVTGLTAANLDATISSRASQASVDTVDGVVDSILTDTGNILTAVDAVPTAVENADALLARNVAGGSSAGRTVKQALYPSRNKTEIAGGTLTVYEVDDTTPSWDATVTTAAGDPISGVDPA